MIITNTTTIKKYLTLFFTLLCINTLYAQRATWRLIDSLQTTSLSIELPTPKILSAKDYPEGKIPYFEDGVFISPAGEPDLPELSYKLPVADSKGATILRTTVLDSVSSSVKIAPARTPRINGQPLLERRANDSYKEDRYFPSEFLSLSTPYLEGGEWYQILYVRPCRYNPLRETLVTKLQLRITLQGVRKRGKKTTGFSQGLFSSEEQGALLVVTPPHYLTILQPFIDWKRERGLKVEVLLFGAPSEDYPSVRDTTALVNYIRTRYKKLNDPLRFVLLVGNRSEVPPLRRDAPLGAKADSDQAYGQLVGNDPRNEVYIGRFSVYTAAHLQTQIQRVIWYERDVRFTATGFNHGLCIASNEGQWIGDNGETDVEHTQKMREVLLGSGYTSVQFLADGQPSFVTAAEVATAINRQVGVVTYVGHGLPTKWSTSNFSNSDIWALEANSIHPVIFNTACDNGKMEAGQCFAETWLWAQRNGNPTGAIGITASSDAQYWEPPMRGQDMMLEYFTKRREAPYVITLGGIVSKGINEMFQVYHDTPKSLGRITAELWNIFGDPSLILRTRAPEPLTVSHPDELLAEDTNFEIHCTSKQIQATIKISTPEGKTSYHNAIFVNGIARFIGLRLVENATVHLTVYGYNKETYTADIPCTSASPSALRLKSLTLQPLTTSSTDYISAGDIWQIVAKIRASKPLEGLVANLTTRPQTSVQLEHSQIALPNLATPNQEEEILLGKLSIDEYAQDNQKFSLTLTIGQGTEILAKRSLPLTISAPTAVIDSVWSATNIVATAGEALQFKVRISNKRPRTFQSGKLRFYWERTPDMITEQDLPNLPTERSLELTQTVTLPSSFEPMEKATLHVELWRGTNKIAMQQYTVGGHLPLAPNLHYTTTYPFATTAAKQETLFFFNTPANIHGHRRLIAVEFPIYYPKNELHVSALYADIISQNTAPLHSDPIEFKPTELLTTGALPIQDGYIRIPLVPYEYNALKDQDLVLRIQSTKTTNLQHYFVPTLSTSHAATRVKEEVTPGKYETHELRTLPTLRFIEAEVSGFTLLVINAERQPIPFAEITIGDKKYTTTAMGELKFSQLEGNYSVRVYSDDYGSQDFMIALRKEQPTYTLQMKHTNEVELTCLVEDTQMHKIPGVEIRTNEQTYYTNTEGYAKIRLHGGKQTLHVYADGYKGGAFTLRIEHDTKYYKLTLAAQEETSTFAVSCAPNPTSRELRIASQCIMNSIRLYDLYGKRLAQYTLHGYSYTLDLNSLPRGLYIVEIYSPTSPRPVRQRFIKER